MTDADARAVVKQSTADAVLQVARTVAPDIEAERVRDAAHRIVDSILNTYLQLRLADRASQGSVS